jgi:predicted metal-dependent phosphoesterase TrpH
MASKLAPLLCELHAHTTWSNGTLPGHHVQEAGLGRYLAELEAEAERARRQYDLVLVPGLELTYEHDDPAQAGHAVALGLTEFVGVGDGLEEGLRAARAHGAALLAAHPYRLAEARRSVRRTAAFAGDPERWTPLVDRFELFNRETRAHAA